MKIEVWQNTNVTGKKSQTWHWHFKARNGRIIADAEAFPSKANAIRAAKGVVRSLIGPDFLMWREVERKDGVVVLTW